MRSSVVLLRMAVVAPLLLAVVALAEPPPSPEAATLRAIYTEALAHGQAYDNLKVLVANCPGRLAGSKALDRAVDWGRTTLAALPLDVKVPHWERGEPESVVMLSATGASSLAATALGNSAATPQAGVTGEVVEVHALPELAALGRAKLEGKIVFFNRPMNPAFIAPGEAYGDAGDQRFNGPAEAGKYGAVGVLVRSLTHAHDDVPHTGVTKYADGVPQVPAAAVSTVAADRLSAAIAATHGSGSAVRVTMKINSKWFPDAPSHNVIGEIRGSEFPDQVIVVGGHLDSWDIAPGAHDDGAGVVQSIEVLRLFRALGLKPRHTLRCVLFVNEENGTAGAKAYGAAAKTSGEKHLFALETDAGGFQPRRFNLTAAQGNPAAAAARWLPLFQPYGVYEFHSGDGGTDVEPLAAVGAVVGELRPDSQRYFDIHHTVEDSIDKVNPRELHLGAAALASLIYLVDEQGL
jgi:carboxypeptidase Q